MNLEETQLALVLCSSTRKYYVHKLSKELRSKFDGDLIALSDNYNDLLQVKKNLNAQLPRILLNREIVNVTKDELPPSKTTTLIRGRRGRKSTAKQRRDDSDDILPVKKNCNRRVSRVQLRKATLNTIEEELAPSKTTTLSRKRCRPKSAAKIPKSNDNCPLQVKENLNSQRSEVRLTNKNFNATKDEFIAPKAAPLNRMTDRQKRATKGQCVQSVYPAAECSYANIANSDAFDSELSDIGKAAPSHLTYKPMPLSNIHDNIFESEEPRHIDTLPSSVPITDDEKCQKVQKLQSPSMIQKLSDGAMILNASGPSPNTKIIAPDGRHSDESEDEPPSNVLHIDIHPSSACSADIEKSQEVDNVESPTATKQLIVSEAKLIANTPTDDFRDLETEAKLIANKPTDDFRDVDTEAKLIANKATDDFRDVDTEAKLIAIKPTDEFRDPETGAKLIANKPTDDFRDLDTETKLIANKPTDDFRDLETEAKLIANKPTDDFRDLDTEAKLIANKPTDDSQDLENVEDVKLVETSKNGFRELKATEIEKEIVNVNNETTVQLKLLLNSTTGTEGKLTNVRNNSRSVECVYSATENSMESSHIDTRPLSGSNTDIEEAQEVYNIQSPMEIEPLIDEVTIVIGSEPKSITNIQAAGIQDTENTKNLRPINHSQLPKNNMGEREFQDHKLIKINEVMKFSHTSEKTNTEAGQDKLLANLPTETAIEVSIIRDVVHSVHSTKECCNTHTEKSEVFNTELNDIDNSVESLFTQIPVPTSNVIDKIVGSDEPRHIDTDPPCITSIEKSQEVDNIESPTAIEQVIDKTTNIIVSEPKSIVNKPAIDFRNIETAEDLRRIKRPLLQKNEAVENESQYSNATEYSKAKVTENLDVTDVELKNMDKATRSRFTDTAITAILSNVQDNNVGFEELKHIVTLPSSVPIAYVEESQNIDQRESLKAFEKLIDEASILIVSDSRPTERIMESEVPHIVEEKESEAMAQDKLLLNSTTEPEVDLRGVHDNLCDTEESRNERPSLPSHDSDASTTMDQARKEDYLHNDDRNDDVGANVSINGDDENSTSCRPDDSDYPNAQISHTNDSVLNMTNLSLGMLDEIEEDLPSDIEEEISPMLHKVLMGGMTSASSIGELDTESGLDQLENLRMGTSSSNAQNLSPPPVNASTASRASFRKRSSMTRYSDATAESTSENEIVEQDSDSDNDDDYHPSDMSTPSLDEDDSDDEVNASATSRESNRRSSTNRSLLSSKKLDLSAKSCVYGADDANMQVTSSEVSKEKKRHYCMFCHKPQSKIYRHLLTVHKNEDEVKLFAVLPPGNAERKKIIDTLRKYGDYLHTSVDNNNGEIVPCRRSKLNKTAKDFKCCANCRGFYSVKNLQKHFKDCINSPEYHGGRNVKILSRTVEGKIHKGASDTLRLLVFPVLKEDETVRLIRYDRLLIIYGNKLCIKYKPQYQHNMIRSRLRLLGRFLGSIKQINESITDFASIYSPKFFDHAVEAVNIVAGYDDATQEYGAPAVAMHLGTYLKQVGEFLINEYIKSEEQEKEKAVKRFLKLMQSEFSVNINTVAMETQNLRKRQKKVLLPTNDDIRKLSKYIKEQLAVSYENLKHPFPFKDWRQLAVFAMISLLVFNRRRVGDIQNILVSDFKNRESIKQTTDKEKWAVLSEESKKVAAKYVRFSIRGKLGRTVPVLVYPELLQSLEAVERHRDAVGIHKNNPFLFGLPSTDKRTQRVLDACEIMRKVSIDCGAEHPERLRGTQLRKHIATTCVELNLSEHAVSDLANSMGHAEKIHKEIYRQPIIQREILGISKLLEAAQGEVSEDDEDSVGGNDTVSSVKENDIGTTEDEISTVNYRNKKKLNTKSPASIPTEFQTSASTSKANIDTEGSRSTQSQPQRTKQRKRPAVQASPSNSDDGNSVGQKRRKITFTTQNCNGMKMKIVRGKATTPESQKKPNLTNNKKRRWSEEEVSAVYSAFERHIARKILPSYKEIREAKASHEVLGSRTLPQIKVWIDNKIRKAKLN